MINPKCVWRLVQQGVCIFGVFAGATISVFPAFGASSLGAPAETSPELVLCEGGKCRLGKRDDAPSLLSQLMSFLAGSKARRFATCMADPKSRVCTTPTIKYEAWGGPFHGDVGFHGFMMTGESAKSEGGEFAGIVTYLPNTWNDRELKCAPTRLQLVWKGDGFPVLRTDASPCEGRIFTMPISFEMAVDYVDLSGRMVGGNYTVTMTGGASGEGKGYTVLYFDQPVASPPVFDVTTAVAMRASKPDVPAASAALPAPASVSVDSAAAPVAPARPAAEIAKLEEDRIRLREERLKMEKERLERERAAVAELERLAAERKAIEEQQRLAQQQRAQVDAELARQREERQRVEKQRQEALALAQKIEEERQRFEKEREEFAAQRVQVPTVEMSSHALVIGNSAYAGGGRLANPSNDAKAVAGKLRGFGFKVTEAIDVSRARLAELLANFSRSAADADLSIFFYAGHAVQIQGTNYIIPVDYDMRDSAQVTYQGVNVNALIEASLPGKTKLVFLDACRDNPLSRSLGRNLRLGLAPPIIAVEGTLISYATRDGSVAEDGYGLKNSPFTTALLENLDSPDDIAVVLRKVRERVMQLTNGRQQPWEYGSLTGGSLVLPAIRQR